MRDQNRTFGLKGVYHTLYNSTTRPDFKFGVTRYFIDEWLPVLGASSAWLIVGLRQHCYWNRRQAWCIVDKATLAKDTSLDERTIERSLKKEYSSWFVKVTHRYRYRTDLGKRVRDRNRYELLLDDPLSPRHQLALAEQLRSLVGSETDTLDDAIAAIQKLLDTPHLTDKISYTNTVPKNLPHRTLLQLVEDTWHLNLTTYANDKRAVQLNQACDRLYNRIVQPNKVYVGWQYFRQKWVLLLGQALAWIIIYLRTRCFWDEKTGELRDEIVLYKKDLAVAIGQTPRNMGNLLNSPYAHLFFTIVDEGARNQPTRYQVRMVDEPLTPEDQQYLAKELNNQLQGKDYDMDPENGQLNFLPQLSNRQNFTYGEISEILPISNRKFGRLDDSQPEKMPQLGTGKNAATGKDSLLPKNNIIQEQQKYHAAAAPNGVETILNDLEIYEPTRSKLLAKPDLTVAHIGAWFLYAETQENLKDTTGYVIKRLLENDPPPPDFLKFSELDDMTWNLFDETVYRMRVGRPLIVDIEPNLRDIFLRWVEIYGGLDSAEARILLDRQPPDDTPEEQPVESMPAHSDANQTLWQNVLGQLRTQMTRATFDNWVKGTRVISIENDLIVVETKNSFAKDWLENRLYTTIHRTVSSIVGRSVEIKFVLKKNIHSQ